MRLIGRLLLTIFVIAAGMMWVRSRWRMDAAVLLLPPGGRVQALASHRGRVCVLRSEVKIDDRPGRRLLLCTERVDWAEEELGRLGFASAAPVVEFLVRYERGQRTQSGRRRATPPDWSMASVPYWVLLPAPAVLAALSWRRPVRRWRWRRSGRCVECGYDLRCSPLGCPECGAGRAGQLT
ncbi:MAG: hypothetical protein ABSH20_04855 [Tepidisphaeraceae bacterium]|jgi:hypothetical protein